MVKVLDHRQKIIVLSLFFDSVLYRALFIKTLAIHHKIDENNRRIEIAVPHYELLKGRYLF